MSLRDLEIEALLPLAKHGRLFRTPWLNEYFHQQPWYRPTGCDAKDLTESERARVDAVRTFIASLTKAELAKRSETLRDAEQQAVWLCPRALVTSGGKGNVPERLATLHLGGELVLWDLATRKRRLVDTRVDAWTMHEPAFAREGRSLFAPGRLTHWTTVGAKMANCADSVAISCAPDLDGKPGGEILAVIACRTPNPCPDCGADANPEYTALAANVILSPPAPGRPNWTEHGFVSCRENSSHEGDPQSMVQGYLRLPDGEVAISTLHSAASSDDGRERCGQSLYALRQGKWQEVMSGETALCKEEGLPEEPEEFDVY